VNTNYTGNSVHELPSDMGRIIINVPHKEVTWMREDNKKEGFKNCIIQAEMWGGNLWMPDPRTCNAVILKPKSVNDPYPFKPKKAVSSVQKIMGGVKADGILVPKGDIFGIGTADCPTIVISDESLDLVLAVHAGRNSLLDIQYIHTGKRSRKTFGVVESAVKALGAEGSRLENLSIYVCCGIGPRHFVHSLVNPTYGEKNKVLVSFLRKQYGPKTFQKANHCSVGLNLFEIIVAQFEEFGVRRSQIFHDGVDTGKRTFKHSGGNELKSALASHRRKTNSRNFVMIHHSRHKLEDNKNLKKKPVPKDGH